MPTFAFYELSPGNRPEGLARLISFLVSQGKVAVFFDEQAMIARLGECLWNLPPSLLVPHGVHGKDADEELDPVILYPPGVSTQRRIVVLASCLSYSEIGEPDLVVEPVSSDPQDKKERRDRFKQYREEGKNPLFVSWKEWGSSGSI